MPNEPKKRHSRQRQGKRRAHITLAVTKAVKCQNCGTPHMPHTVCATCGYYRGHEVLKPKQKKQQPAA